MNQVNFFYDDYEKMFGDGFYPQLEKCDTCSKSVNIQFKKVWIEIWSSSNQKPLLWIPYVFETKEDMDKYKNKIPELQTQLVWKQVDGDCISGLDGTCGSELFTILEKKDEEKSFGIVNINNKFIYSKTKEEMQEAERIIKHHAAMPYVLGGTCAKYQGLENTIEYLHREHPSVFTFLTNEKIKELIQKTIKEEMT